MRILLVNDDGIYAPGLELLAKKAIHFGEVWVVAPARQCSAMSHKVKVFGSLQVERVWDYPVTVNGAYKVEGSPADCVKIAMQYLMPEKPDWVFSGINDGCNIGYEMAYSGTLAATFEAAMYGVPAIAFSSAYKVPMTLADRYLLPIAEELMAEPKTRGTVWNVNFPDETGKTCKGILRDRKIAPTWLYTGTYHPVRQEGDCTTLKISGEPLTTEDALSEGSDMEAVLNGFISIGKVKSFVFQQE